MKLQVLSEARYHKDPHKQFLNRFFDKVDTQDNGDGTHMESWQVKDDYVGVVDGVNDRAFFVANVIVGVDPESNRNSYNIFVYDWDEPLPTEKFDLKDIDIYQKVT